MIILAIYSSKTGNTKKLAEYVLEGIKKVKGVEVLLKSASKVTKSDFLKADGIIAGSPVYFGTMSAELKDMFDRFVGLRKKMENKVGAAFATSGDETGRKETTLLSILQAMLIYGMIIVGDPLDASGHYGVACVGAPDIETIHNAQKLGKRVAQLVVHLRSNTF